MKRDAKELVKQMNLFMGMSTEEIERLIRSCRKRHRPSKHWTGKQELPAESRGLKPGFCGFFFL